MSSFFEHLFPHGEQKKEDPRIQAIEELLPGYNCGGCGNAGCHIMAEKLLRKEAEISGCRPCSHENAEKIIKYLAEHR